MNFKMSKLTLQLNQFYRHPQRFTSPKIVCILFQALTALIVIGFFPYKLVQKEGLRILLAEEAAVL